MNSKCAGEKEESGVGQHLTSGYMRGSTCSSGTPGLNIMTQVTENQKAKGKPNPDKAKWNTGWKELDPSP